MFMTYAACALLLIGSLTYIFWNQRTLLAPATKTRLDYLSERKDVVYENLRDLNFEYRAGKYPAEDYSEQRESLELEAATIVGEMERLEAAKPAVRRR
jgi:hypothetical protein